MRLLLMMALVGLLSAATPTSTVGQMPPQPYLRGFTLLSANLRDAPSMQSEIVAVAKEGALLDVLEQRGSWLRVRTEVGVEAWIHKSLLRLASEHLEPEPLQPPPPAPVPSAPVSPPAPLPVAKPLAAYEMTASPPEPTTSLMLTQPDGAAEPRLPTSTSEFWRPLHMIAPHLQELGGYLIAGLAVMVLVAIGLQLRAAQQLKRTRYDMHQILELVEALQAEHRPELALNPVPTAASAPPAAVSSPSAGPVISLTPVERVVVEAITEHGELHERELSHILAAKGFTGVLIKAVIGDLVRKTTTDGLPWVGARYAHGRFAYYLRGQGRRATRAKPWQD